MTHVRLLLFTMLFLSTATVFAQKNNVAEPINIQFVFENQDTVILTNPDSLQLKSYSQEILEQKRKLRSAQLTFKTGERIFFAFDHAQLTGMRIQSETKEVTIPQETIDKITEIHFHTVTLIWDGAHPHASDASYAYITFDTGTVKTYDHYPYVQLSFEQQAFSEAFMWTPADASAYELSHL